MSNLARTIAALSLALLAVPGSAAAHDAAAPAAAAGAAAPIVAPVVQVSAAGFAVVAVRCPSAGPRCTGSVQLQVVGARPQRVGFSAFTARGRRTLPVGVRLNDAGVRRLLRSGMLPVRATVTAAVGRQVRVTRRGLVLRKPAAPARPAIVPGATADPRAASFSLRATRGSAFLCSLDGRPEVRCANPAVITGLADGEHVLRVRATHRVRGLSAPATFTWRVVPPVVPSTGEPTGPTPVPPTPPVTPPPPVTLPSPPPALPPTPSITAGPSGTTTSSTARFSFTAAGGPYTFLCALDAAPFAACTSPVSYRGLALDGHTFRVKAQNASGDGPQAVRTWTVEPLRPDLVAGIEDLGIRTVDLGDNPHHGKRALFFATDVINVGRGPLEIRSTSTVCDSPDGTGRVAAQRVFRDMDGDGIFGRPADESGSSSKVIGCIAYHAAHRHQHFQDFGVYRLFRYELRDGAYRRGALVSESDKVSYCMIDEKHYDPSLVSSPATPFYPYARVCQAGEESFMGVSVGWNDQYGSSRPDQFVPLQGVPDGRYCLEVKTDYQNLLTETNDGNNDASMPVTIEGTSVSSDTPTAIRRSLC